jgi:hypothetical protein
MQLGKQKGVDLVNQTLTEQILSVGVRVVFCGVDEEEWAGVRVILQVVHDDHTVVVDRHVALEGFVPGIMQFSISNR